MPEKPLYTLQSHHRNCNRAKPHMSRLQGCENASNWEDCIFRAPCLGRATTRSVFSSSPVKAHRPVQMWSKGPRLHLELAMELGALLSAVCSESMRRGGRLRPGSGKLIKVGNVSQVRFGLLAQSSNAGSVWSRKGQTSVARETPRY